MNGGVVEFDSLTDPDRTGAKDDDDGLFGAVFRDKSGSLVLLVSGGVEVGVSAANSAPQVSTIL